MENKQLVTRAFLLASEGYYEEALSLLRSTPELDNDVIAMELRARLFHDKGDQASARLEWMNLLQAHPGNEKAKEVLRNTTGLRGWFWSWGKYLTAGIACAVLILGGVFVGQATRPPVSDGSHSKPRPGSPEFLIPADATAATTALLKEFLAANLSEATTLLIFSERPVTATIVSDMAIDLGCGPKSILCLPMGENSSLSAVLRIVEGECKEFRYDN